ncbi:MAG: DUF1993 domain-containing protein [Porticoccaceae bacterium]|jgi:hypothetical protein|nr:DUF1993 domain-containing protein [Porticoccaceae bacterium]
MTFSLYDISLPVLLQGLDNLAVVVAKGKAFCEENGIEEAALLDFRFRPDMYQFARQVKTAADTAVMGAVRLTGEEPVLTQDVPTSFEGLLQLIASSREVVAAVTPEQLGANQGQAVSFTAMGTFRMTFAAQADYLQKFILPNFYFHCATTYDMLRHNGVELGKKDFLGDFGGAITPL